MTLRLPRDMHQRLRREAFDREVSQTSLITSTLAEWLDSPCPDCGVQPGTQHHRDCDMPHCPQTSLQRLICRSDGHNCGDVTWKGYGYGS